MSEQGTNGDNRVIIALLQEQNKNLFLGQGKLEGKLDLISQHINDMRDNVSREVDGLAREVNAKVDAVNADIRKRADEAEDVHGDHSIRLTKLETNMAWFKVLWSPVMTVGGGVAGWLIMQVLGSLIGG
jgi:hypothetical protein